MWEIKGKDNQLKATINSLEYNGEWMGESYVTVTVESPAPINFEIGDYIIYRDERFEINYDPGKIKSAPRYEKEDAFKYENIKFNSLADELTWCDFLDIVLNDNQLHFTGLPKFSFYGGVKDLANRMQANLDRTYGKGTWSVVVSPEFQGGKEVNISVDTIKVQGALSILVNELETYYTIKGRTITIGAAGIPAGHLFKYGKGNGLYEIEQNAEADQAIVTRLRAYGSTRNLPHRYYNSLSGADGKKLIPDNMAVQYLMLPEFPYTTQDPYIDSPNIAKLGIREGTVFFDGSGELEEIYPSIEGMTAEQLKAAGVPCNSTGALDEIVSAEQMTDNGVGEINEGETQTTAKPPTFKVTLKDLGFDINDHLTTETATLSFKTGMLGGRDFEIVGRKKIESGGKVTGYELELNRVYDDGIKLWFPYSAYNAQAGDKFVILYIEMPEVYIKAAAQRLKEAATEWLSKNDYSRSIYAPKVDEIFMARQHDLAMASGGKIKSLHDTLKEGMLLLFEDEDLNIDASIFIDRLTIKEEGAVPTYEVVLKEEKTVGRLDKMQNQIDSLAAGKGQGGGGYTAAQIRSMIDAYGGSRFLSKIKSDRTPYGLSVGGLLKAEDRMHFGEFMSGAFGGSVDSRGNLEMESGVFRSFVQIYELIVNRQRTFDSDVIFAEGDTIEEITPFGMSDEGNARFTLKMHEEWKGYTTALYEGDVIRGIYNNITGAAPSGDGTTTVNNATYYTSWMRVIDVRPGKNEVDVVVYPDADTPAGRNFDPSPMMKVARWGNAGSTEAQKKRQRLVLISSTEARVKVYYHVTKPIIDEGNVATVLGEFPEFLLGQNPAIREGDTGIYAKVGVFETIIQRDHLGRPEPQIVYRGQYDPGADYYDGTAFVESSRKYEQSCVLYYGCQWLCTKAGAKNPPSWDSTDWSLYQGDPRLRLEWAGSEDSVYEDSPEITLEVLAEIYHQDVTSDPKIKWDWTRESWHNGSQDTASDALWNASHENVGNSLRLVKEDMNYSFGKRPDRLTYIVTATLIDKNGEPLKSPDTGSPATQKMAIEI
ncbi:MAG: hypothetical protein K1V90_08850 [Muribaculaceae bacterium]